MKQDIINNMNISKCQYCQVEFQTNRHTKKFCSFNCKKYNWRKKRRQVLKAEKERLFLIVCQNKNGLLAKKCTKCNKILTIEHYAKRPNSKIIYKSHCKICTNEGAKNWRKNNPEKCRIKHKRENRKPRTRFADSKRRAIKDRGIIWELTFDEYEPLLKLPCHYCGKQLPCTGVGLDRKDSGGGYIVANVVPCCFRCNVTFGDRFNYDEKLILANAIKEVDKKRETS